MPGIDFDRQAFVASNPPQTRSANRLFGSLMLVGALAVIGLIGYKIFTLNAQNNAAAANAQVQHLGEQLSEIEKRLNAVEKHRKAAPAEAPSVPAPVVAVPAPTWPPRTVYRIAAASTQPAQVNTANSSASTEAPTAPTPVASAEFAGAFAENREAWEATTNRLADVVGVVGIQQSELSATRDAVNQLLAQTHRQALSFEVSRHSNPTPVGPVTLQFKSADMKSQLYTLYIFFNNQKCIELRDRALNEVVVFVVAKNQPPLELVATKIKHDQVVGYLEVPTAMQQ